MKKTILLFSIFASSMIFAQEGISSKNSWLKGGLTVGVPVGDFHDLSSVAVGADLRAQYLVTPNFGIGGATGYNHFFGKNNSDDFGLIPVAAFARYYFKSEGVFIGTDLGYGFLTNAQDNAGGLYVNPQIGYHNSNWNIYGFFQNTFAENDKKIQNVGIGATYNLKF